MPLSERLTILIPTWNAARHLDLVLDYYRGLGIAPTLLVDSKTSDGTLNLAQTYGCPTIIADNPTTRAQYIIETGARAISTDWALRMDDDEVPSGGMITYINAVLGGLAPESIVGFPRHQCAIREGRLLTSTKHTSHEHRQWRLFQPSVVRYTERGHTPGYEVPESSRLPAPDYAAMLHFDWVVHSPQERAQKIMRYDSHTPNHGSFWRDYYLADTLDDFESGLVPVDFPETAILTTGLYLRFAKHGRSQTMTSAQSTTHDLLDVTNIHSADRLQDHDPTFFASKGTTSEGLSGVNVRFIRINQMPAWLRNVLVTLLVAAVTIYATLWVADHAPPNMIWLAFLPPVLIPMLALIPRWWS
jgi:hypothetical protein